MTKQAPSESYKDRLIDILDTLAIKGSTPENHAYVTSWAMQAIINLIIESITNNEITDKDRDPGYYYYKGRNDLREEIRNQWQ